MTTPSNQSTIRCAQCQQPFNTTIRTVIDVQTDPEGKAMLLSGRLNRAQCPHCGHVNQIVAPVLYHDAEQELLISHIPMEVQKGQSEEQIVGELMNDLTRLIGKEQFKAYMFKPATALTIQGMVNQILEADGITPDMLESQKQRVELIQQMVETPDDDTLRELVKEHDDSINLEFFQTLTMMAQRVMEDGRRDIAVRLAEVQDMLLEQTSFGQELQQQQTRQNAAINSVAQEIDELGEDASRDDFRNLAITYADDEDKLQALVGLIRPVFDYEFFQEFTSAISKAPATERETMENVRDQLVELTQQVDEQMQQMVQQSAQFLMQLMNSENPTAMLQANAHLIDDNFMTVLTANLQEAQRRQDQQTLQRLSNIYQEVVQMLQSQMSPELRFLNELLSTPDDDTMRRMISERIDDFDGELAEAIESASDMLRSQGQTDILQRLEIIKQEVQKAQG